MKHTKRYLNSRIFRASREDLARIKNKIASPHSDSNVRLAYYIIFQCGYNLERKIYSLGEEEYGSVGLVSRRCDVYSYSIMLMETFTRRRPYDEMFHENLSMRSWVCNSLPVAPDDIIDVTLWEPEETDFEKKLQCVSSILELALNCTVESPNERLNMKDVLANIMKIKHEFLRK
ncbi:probable LRR receptor-like serine/threonine-protein kinase At3g47570 isoform X2 [Lycium ferocissimum]|uniref:probable LRR receptor-like serine/threonine-protein kinase At3g47570 isoform X2 n=1 Tax=Lycium ferocissimum TaxID=112874 RepID=UPI002815B76F|nr:probable LRR receptor-like serine/threonine-protein kinase At3g47570 isoform X2 [Lycium ferocissimum]